MASKEIREIYKKSPVQGVRRGVISAVLTLFSFHRVNSLIWAHTQIMVYVLIL